MNTRKSSAVCALLLLLNLLFSTVSVYAQAANTPSSAAKSVVLAGSMSDHEFLRLSAAIDDSVLLVDRPFLAAANLRFLQSFHPNRVVRIGDEDPGAQVGFQLSELATETVTTKYEIFLTEKPHHTLVVCPAEPRAALLQATCLAAGLQADLRICNDEGSDVVRQVDARAFQKVYAIGAAAPECRRLWPGRVTSLANAQAVADAYVSRLRQDTVIRTLVVANPADLAPGKGRLSTLAPWVAQQKRAALVLTNE